MNRGVPPTALKARTGEFTPPGVTARARSNSAAERAGPADDGAVTGSLSPSGPTGPTRGCRPRSSNVAGTTSRPDENEFHRHDLREWSSRERGPETSTRTEP